MKGRKWRRDFCWNEYCCSWFRTFRNYYSQEWTNWVHSKCASTWILKSELLFFFKKNQPNLGWGSGWEESHSATLLQPWRLETKKYMKLWDHGALWKLYRKSGTVSVAVDLPVNCISVLLWSKTYTLEQQHVLKWWTQHNRHGSIRSRAWKALACKPFLTTGRTTNFSGQNWLSVQSYSWACFADDRSKLYSSATFRSKCYVKVQDANTLNK